MSLQSRSVSAGAESPPPRRLSPLRFDSRPPMRTAHSTRRAAHRDHGEADAAIVQDQHVAGSDALGQAREVHAHGILVAGGVGQLAIEREGRAVAELHRAVAEAADADLRSLQVAEQCDLAARACRQQANQPGACAVVLDLAVGEVQAEHVHAGVDQRRDGLLGTAGRPQRGHDLGASLHAHAKLPAVVCAAASGNRAAAIMPQARFVVAPAG